MFIELSQKNLNSSAKILAVLFLVNCLFISCRSDSSSKAIDSKSEELSSLPKEELEAEDEATLEKQISSTEIIDHQNIDFDLLSNLIHQEVNEIKKARKLPQVEVDEVLNNAAIDQNNYQVAKGILSHSQDRLEKEGLRDRIEFYGGGFRAMAENVLYEGFLVQTSGSSVNVITPTYAEQAKKMVTSWMNSPGHRRNILNSTYDKVGTAVAYNPQLRAVFATQVFGKKF